MPLTIEFNPRSAAPLDSTMNSSKRAGAALQLRLQAIACNLGIKTHQAGKLSFCLFCCSDWGRLGGTGAENFKPTRYNPASSTRCPSSLKVHPCLCNSPRHGAVLLMLLGC